MCSCCFLILYVQKSANLSWPLADSYGGIRAITFPDATNTLLTQTHTRQICTVSVYMVWNRQTPDNWMSYPGTLQELLLTIQSAGITIRPYHNTLLTLSKSASRTKQKSPPIVGKETSSHWPSWPIGVFPI